MEIENYKAVKIKSTIKILLTLALVFSAAQIVFASETNGTIASGGNNGYAWSNQAGWVNFGCSNCGISITDSGVTGHAWSNNYGWINMNPLNGGVTVAANGALSGYAWGSGLGWINFSGVSINSSGKLVGTASGTNVGTLTFDCANCSVATDFRPQNFRTVAPAPTLTPTLSVGGGGIIGGAGALGAPPHITTFNVPMRLYPAQSGILTQGLTNQKSVVLDVPTNVFSDEVTFVVNEEAVSIAPTAEIQVIGNALFNVLAVDKNGNRIQTFEKFIKITFIVPESLRGRSDLAVYFFDETSRTPNQSKLGTGHAWVKIPDAVFSGDSVSFSVDHLTLFAIFAGSELPLVAASTFPVPIPFEFEIPRPEIGAPGGEQVLEGEVPAEEISEENPPLFDIEVKPGTLESKSKTNLVVIVTMAITGIVAAIYMFLKKKRDAKQRDEI